MFLRSHIKYSCWCSATTFSKYFQKRLENYWAIWTWLASPVSVWWWPYITWKGSLLSVCSYFPVCSKTCCCEASSPLLAKWLRFANLLQRELMQNQWWWIKSFFCFTKFILGPVSFFNTFPLLCCVSRLLSLGVFCDLLCLSVRHSHWSLLQVAKSLELLYLSPAVTMLSWLVISLFLAVIWYHSCSLTWSSGESLLH